MKKTPKKIILDACCGSRMFWFNREHPNTIYMDKRKEKHLLKDKSVKGGLRKLVIAPDVLGDFTDMPFDAKSFSLVIFDPPHLVNPGKNGWQAKKYGALRGDWKKMIADGFSECFRVLKVNGILVFKWHDYSAPLREILALTPQEPLIGHRSGKQAKTHWVVFMKGVGK